MTKYSKPIERPSEKERTVIALRKKTVEIVDKITKFEDSKKGAIKYKIVDMLIREGISRLYPEFAKEFESEN